MNDEVTEEKEKAKGNGSKKKRIAIIIIIALIAIIVIIAIVTNVTISSTAGDDTENLATLKVSSDGSYELTVVNYASSDVGEQNFIIQKTDEYSNPLEGVEFEIVGNFRTSYSVEYLRASDDEGTNFEKLDEYTQVFYDSCWDERYFTTDSNGNISLTLQYGDYVVEETSELYGYDKSDTNFCIRVDKSGISLIDEEDVSWEDPNFDEESVLRVRTASIEDQLSKIEKEKGYTVKSINLNNDDIGDNIDDLPEIVSDEDVIYIYLKGGFYYNVKYMTYYGGNGDYYDDYEGNKVIDELSYIKYVDSALDYIDGKATVEVNWQEIDDMATINWIHEYWGWKAYYPCDEDLFGCYAYIVDDSFNDPYNYNGKVEVLRIYDLGHPTDLWMDYSNLSKFDYNINANWATDVYSRRHNFSRS